MYIRGRNTYVPCTLTNGSGDSFPAILREPSTRLQELCTASMADLIDDLTEDDAHSGIVVEQQSFTGCFPEDIMEGNCYESQCLGHCMTEEVGHQTQHHKIRGSPGAVCRMWFHLNYYSLHQGMLLPAENVKSRLQ